MVAVATEAGLHATVGGGQVFYHTQHAVAFEYLEIEPAAAQTAASVVELDVTLPADALLQAAHFAVSAVPVGPVKAAAVATIRPSGSEIARSGACSIDFGRLVTVSGVGYDVDVYVAGSLPNLSRVSRWTGASWELIVGTSSFAEVATERLLVETNDVDSDELSAIFARTGDVDLPAVPGLLELTVAGSTVWFERQGSSPIDLELPAAAGGTSYVIDRTAAVRQALEQAPVTDGERTVRIALRAASPGKLTLTPTIAALRVHTVAFQPDGVVHAVDVTEEGELGFDVTPPNAADVREVALTVRGTFGAERVQPPVGPPLVGEAWLALAPARSVLVGLPDVLTSRFGKLTGVRLVLRAGPGTNGGQVTGRLLADVGGRPGEPIPGGDLTAVTVAAGVERFWTLPFAEAVAPPVLPPPEPAATAHRISAWLELQLAHGEVESAFTGNDPNDPVAPGAVVLRRMPGGGTGGLTAIPALGPPLRLAVRIVGLPDRERPIPAIAVRVEGSPDAIGVTPTSDDLAARLTLHAPLPVTGPVLLRTVAAAPGSLTLDTVQVTYREDV